ncbi:MAG TPA: DUF58 domain-containing protein [Gemmatimonadaceae bacterium]|nr:DUF58 domain-containing protein [Gemmatimonadaceae bacterium]
MDAGTTAQATRADLFDPASLAALGRIEIVARWVVDGFMSGLHRSPRKGFSVEFAEFRPYLPGDDLRYVDWKIAGRSDRWVVKQFEEETNLRASLVLDVSQSMNWSGAQLRGLGGSAPPAGHGLTKLAYAERLSAALALLLLRQRDAVGLVRFDSEVRSAVPPRARTGQWRRIISALEEPGAGRSTSAVTALEQAARLITRRGMIVLISDLLMDIPDVERAVRGLRAAGHDVVVLHIMDPAERDLPAGGEALFVDPESALEVAAAVSDVRQAYRQTVAEVVAEWRSMLSALGAGYELVPTDVPFGVPLRRAFAARQQLP